MTISAAICGANPLHAQKTIQDIPVQFPALFDFHLRDELSEDSDIRQIRFLTESDYPPFQFLRSDGELAGFNIDLARAICEDLKATCTVQPWRWDKLNDALADGAGDAIIASQKPDAASRARFSFSVPYYPTPARFVALKNMSLNIARPADLKGKTVGTVANSAHEAYAKLAFPAATLKSFPTLAEAQQALLKAEIDTVFADGPTLAIWLASDQGALCAFNGGGFYESYFFGEGARITLRPDSNPLRLAINASLKRLDARGTLAELTWKYFPVSFYDVAGLK
eukprot:gene7015-7084_t